MSLSRILLLIAIALMPLETWAVPTKDIEVRLESKVPVATQRIVLGDVATIYAKSMRDFKGLSELEISQIPEDQNELRLPQSYLEHRIREMLPAGVEFALHAPKEIVFELKRLGITPAELSSEINRLALAGGKIPKGIESEIEILTNPDQLKLLTPDQLRIEPSAEMASWRGELAFKAVDKNQQISWVKARVRWFANVWVAQKQIGITQPIEALAFTQERRELTNIREELLQANSLEELTQKLGNARARRAIAPNALLTAGMVERKPDAGPGQLLKVVFVSESGIRVSAEGALLGAGTVGNEAKAKLKSSRKIVTGKLVSGNVMEVSL